MYYHSNSGAYFEGDHWPSVYGDQLEAAHRYGVTREVRGTISYELRPIVAVVEHTDSPFIVVPGRGLNHSFALAETVSIIAAHNSVEFLRFYNAQMSLFSNDGEKFEGHYGERLERCNQLGYMARELARDPGSRRAMCTIWDPRDDTLSGHKDYPCNVTLMFKVFNDKLDAHVVRRSSDLLWGAPYDHVVFTTIHAMLAAELSVKVGRMIETADSLHIYRGLYDDALERALQATKSGKIWANCTGHSCARLAETRQICKNIVLMHYELRKSENCTWKFINKMRFSISEGWWGEAWVIMAAYHLWKAKKWDDFMELAYSINPGFRSALFSTFEARIQSRVSELGRKFADDFGRACCMHAVNVLWQNGREEK